MLGVVGLALRMALHQSFDRSIDDPNFARLAVQLEKYRPRPVFPTLPGRQIPDEQRLALLDLDRRLLAGLKTIEEVRRRNRRGVAVSLPVRQVILEHLRIQQVRQDIFLTWLRVAA